MTPRPFARAAGTLALVLAALCAAADPAPAPAEAEAPTDLLGTVLDTVADGLAAVGSTAASAVTSVASFATTLGVPDPATLIELPGIVLAHAADLGRHDAWAAATYHSAPWLDLGIRLPDLSTDGLRSTPLLALLVATLLAINVALACRWRTLTRPNGGEEARCSP